MYLTFFLILIIFSSIYALLIFLNRANSQAPSFNTFTFIMGVVVFLILGFLAGNTAQRNGLLEGLIAAAVVIMIALIINFFVHVPFMARSFVKTASYLTAAALGGILGVNFRPFIKASEPS
jgi:putative membrane protein (TIGR04086 family)